MKWFVNACVLVCVCFSTFAGDADWQAPKQYEAIKSRLIKGWNTWDSRSVTRQVLLPEGLALDLAFKQHYWLEEQYLSKALIGARGKDRPHVRPGVHSYSGSYTELEIRWQELHARIRTAMVDEDLVILVEPMTPSKSGVNLVLSTAMLWNRPGNLTFKGDHLEAAFEDRVIGIYATARHTDDFYVDTHGPYLNLSLNEAVGISTGKRRSLDDIRRLIETSRTNLQKEADAYGHLSEAYLAVTAGIAWNTIYEPKFDRVVSTVGRLWNEEYGGYCLFGWDNFFLSYMTAMTSRDLAYANVLEHLRGITEEGFIANDNRGNGSKSWDRSQPPVGAIMVKEVYKLYPEKWFLEATFDDLLAWNRFWMRKRLNEGLLSYGSHKAKNPFNEPATQSKRTAGYESGMDDSPMYIGVPFNKEKNTLELQDVGLTSLVIADCHALIEMAEVIGRRDVIPELKNRAAMLSKNMERTWSEEVGFYLNRRTDTDELSMRLSPTLFYPMLAKVPSQDRAKRMIEEHFKNPEEFWGDYMLPSIARNDEVFHKQRYWKGAIWPPLNFLTYLSLREYGFAESAKYLSDKSLEMFVGEWRRKGYVSENYSAITGTGDDSRLSSDRFHSWGALFGMIAFIEEGKVPPTEQKLAK